MAWTAEDRRKYAPAIQDMVRGGMLVRLAQTIEANDQVRAALVPDVVDPDHAHGLVASGPRRLYLATATGHVPATYDGLGPLAWLADAGRARPGLGGSRHLLAPGARPQAAANRGHIVAFGREVNENVAPTA